MRIEEIFVGPERDRYINDKKNRFILLGREKFTDVEIPLPGWEIIFPLGMCR